MLSSLIKSILICLTLSHTLNAMEEPPSEINGIQGGLPLHLIPPRVATNLIFRIPLETITQNQQVNHWGVKQAVRYVYDTNGLSGFYRSTYSRIANDLFRTLYTWLTIGYSQRFFVQTYPELANQHPYLKKLVATMAFTLVDTTLSIPLDRISTLRNTRQKEFHWREVRTLSLSGLYRGLWVPTLTKNFLGCLTFQASDQFFRSHFQGKHPETPLAPHEYALSGLGIATVYTTFTAPIMTLITKLQNQKPNDPQIGLLQLTTNVYRNFGIRGFFPGTLIRFIPVLATSIWETYMLDMVDRWNKN